MAWGPVAGRCQAPAAGAQAQVATTNHVDPVSPDQRLREHVPHSRCIRVANARGRLWTADYGSHGNGVTCDSDQLVSGA